MAVAAGGSSACGTRHEGIHAGEQDSMKTITAFIQRHPVLTYYALVFAISWGGILLIVGGPGGIPGSRAQVEAMMPLVLGRSAGDR